MMESSAAVVGAGLSGRAGEATAPAERGAARPPSPSHHSAVPAAFKAPSPLRQGAPPPLPRGSAGRSSVDPFHLMLASLAHQDVESIVFPMVVVRNGPHTAAPCTHIHGGGTQEHTKGTKGEGKRKLSSLSKRAHGQPRPCEAEGEHANGTSSPHGHAQGDEEHQTGVPAEQCTAAGEQLTATAVAGHEPPAEPSGSVLTGGARLPQLPQQQQTVEVPHTTRVAARGKAEKPLLSTVTLPDSTTAADNSSSADSGSPRNAGVTTATTTAAPNTASDSSSNWAHTRTLSDKGSHAAPPLKPSPPHDRRGPVRHAVPRMSPPLPALPSSANAPHGSRKDGTASVDRAAGPVSGGTGPSHDAVTDEGRCDCRAFPIVFANEAALRLLACKHHSDIVGREFENAFRCFVARHPSSCANSSNNSSTTTITANTSGALDSSLGSRVSFPSTVRGGAPAADGSHTSSRHRGRPRPPHLSRSITSTGSGSDGNSPALVHFLRVPPPSTDTASGLPALEEVREVSQLFFPGGESCLMLFSIVSGAYFTCLAISQSHVNGLPAATPVSTADTERRAAAEGQALTKPRPTRRLRCRRLLSEPGDARREGTHDTIADAAAAAPAGQPPEESPLSPSLASLPRATGSTSTNTQAGMPLPLAPQLAARQIRALPAILPTRRKQTIAPPPASAAEAAGTDWPGHCKGIISSSSSPVQSQQQQDRFHFPQDGQAASTNEASHSDMSLCSHANGEDDGVSDASTASAFARRNPRALNPTPPRRGKSAGGARRSSGEASYLMIFFFQRSPALSSEQLLSHTQLPASGAASAPDVAAPFAVSGAAVRRGQRGMASPDSPPISLGAVSLTSAATASLSYRHPNENSSTLEQPRPSTAPPMLDGPAGALSLPSHTNPPPSALPLKKELPLSLDRADTPTGAEEPARRARELVHARAVAAVMERALQDADSAHSLPEAHLLRASQDLIRAPLATGRSGGGAPRGGEGLPVARSLRRPNSVPNFASDEVGTVAQTGRDGDRKLAGKPPFGAAATAEIASEGGIPSPGGTRQEQQRQDHVGPVPSAPAPPSEAAFVPSVHSASVSPTTTSTATPSSSPTSVRPLSHSLSPPQVSQQRRQDETRAGFTTTSPTHPSGHSPAGAPLSQREDESPLTQRQRGRQARRVSTTSVPFLGNFPPLSESPPRQVRGGRGRGAIMAASKEESSMGSSWEADLLSSPQRHSHSHSRSYSTGIYMPSGKEEGSRQLARQNSFQEEDTDGSSHLATRGSGQFCLQKSSDDSSGHPLAMSFTPFTAAVAAATKRSGSNTSSEGRRGVFPSAAASAGREDLSGEARHRRGGRHDAAQQQRRRQGGGGGGGEKGRGNPQEESTHHRAGRQHHHPQRHRSSSPYATRGETDPVVKSLLAFSPKGTPLSDRHGHGASAIAKAQPTPSENEPASLPSPSRFIPDVALPPSVSQLNFNLHPSSSAAHGGGRKGANLQRTISATSPGVFHINSPIGHEGRRDGSSVTQGLPGYTAASSQANSALNPLIEMGSVGSLAGVGSTSSGLANVPTTSTTPTTANTPSTTGQGGSVLAGGNSSVGMPVGFGSFTAADGSHMLHASHSQIPAGTGFFYPSLSATTATGAAAGSAVAAATSTQRAHIVDWVSATRVKRQMKQVRGVTSVAVSRVVPEYFYLNHMAMMLCLQRAVKFMLESCTSDVDRLIAFVTIRKTFLAVDVLPEVLLNGTSLDTCLAVIQDRHVAEGKALRQRRIIDEIASAGRRETNMNEEKEKFERHMRLIDSAIASGGALSSQSTGHYVPSPHQDNNSPASTSFGGDALRPRPREASVPPRSALLTPTPANGAQVSPLPPLLHSPQDMSFPAAADSTSYSGTSMSNTFRKQQLHWDSSATTSRRHHPQGEHSPGQQNSNNDNNDTNTGSSSNPRGVGFVFSDSSSSRRAPFSVDAVAGAASSTNHPDLLSLQASRRASFANSVAGLMSGRGTGVAGSSGAEDREQLERTLDWIAQCDIVPLEQYLPPAFIELLVGCEAKMEVRSGQDRLGAAVQVCFPYITQERLNLLSDLETVQLSKQKGLTLFGIATANALTEEAASAASAPMPKIITLGYDSAEKRFSSAVLGKSVNVQPLGSQASPRAAAREVTFDESAVDTGGGRGGKGAETTESAKQQRRQSFDGGDRSKQVGVSAGKAEKEAGLSMTCTDTRFASSGGTDDFLPGFVAGAESMGSVPGPPPSEDPDFPGRGRFLQERFRAQQLQLQQGPLSTTDENVTTSGTDMPNFSMHSKGSMTIGSGTEEAGTAQSSPQTSSGSDGKTRRRPTPVKVDPPALSADAQAPPRPVANEPATPALTAPTAVSRPDPPVNALPMLLHYPPQSESSSSNGDCNNHHNHQQNPNEPSYPQYPSGDLERPKQSMSGQALEDASRASQPSVTTTSARSRIPALFGGYNLPASVAANLVNYSTVITPETVDVGDLGGNDKDRTHIIGQDAVDEEGEGSRNRHNSTPGEGRMAVSPLPSNVHMSSTLDDDTMRSGVDGRDGDALLMAGAASLLPCAASAGASGKCETRVLALPVALDVDSDRSKEKVRGDGMKEAAATPTNPRAYAAAAGTMTGAANDPGMKLTTGNEWRRESFMNRLNDSFSSSQEFFGFLPPAVFKGFPFNSSGGGKVARAGVVTSVSDAAPAATAPSGRRKSQVDAFVNGAADSITASAVLMHAASGGSGGSPTSPHAELRKFLNIVIFNTHDRDDIDEALGTLGHCVTSITKPNKMARFLRCGLPGVDVLLVEWHEDIITAELKHLLLENTDICHQAVVLFHVTTSVQLGRTKEERIAQSPFVQELSWNTWEEDVLFFSEDLSTIFHDQESYRKVLEGILKVRLRRKMSAVRLQKSYQVRRQCGSGTFGDVFEVVMFASAGRLAMKQVFLKSASVNVLEQLYREVLIMSQLDHQNIIVFSHTMLDKDTFKIFMQLADGGTLAHLITPPPTAFSSVSGAAHSVPVRRTSAVRATPDAVPEDRFCGCSPDLPIPPHIVVEIVHDIASAIEYLHSRDIIHRDIKPANILFVKDVVKLGDFGSAVTVDERRPLTAMRGTVPYMAPEVFLGQPHGKPCDVWSLGCVIADIMGLNLAHRSGMLHIPALTELYESMSLDESVPITLTHKSSNSQFEHHCAPNTTDKVLRAVREAAQVASRERQRAPPVNMPVIALRKPRAGGFALSSSPLAPDPFSSLPASAAAEWEQENGEGDDVGSLATTVTSSCWRSPPNRALASGDGSGAGGEEEDHRSITCISTTCATLHTAMLPRSLVELFEGLFHRNPAKRMTISDVLCHRICWDIDWVAEVMPAVRRVMASLRETEEEEESGADLSFNSAGSSGDEGISWAASDAEHNQHDQHNNSYRAESSDGSRKDSPDKPREKVEKDEESEEKHPSCKAPPDARSPGSLISSSEPPPLLLATANSMKLDSEGPGELTAAEAQEAADEEAVRAATTPVSSSLQQQQQQQQQQPMHDRASLDLSIQSLGHEGEAHFPASTP